MQFTRRRLFFIGILLLGVVWIALSADTRGATTAGRIPAPQKGFLAPDFTLETPEGETITLSALQGKAVLLNFWATWCPPCRAEMPAFQQAYSTYATEDFVIIAVNATLQDNLDDVASFREEYGLSFPIALDHNGEVNQRYQIRSLPTSFFIDREGVIQEVVIGGPIAEALIRARVEALLD